MENEDRKLAEKIAKFIEFIKKECPDCYKRMKECCSDTNSKSRE